MLLAGCLPTAVEQGVGAGGRSYKIDVAQSSDSYVTLKYSSCLFCSDLPQTAANVADNYCNKFDKKAYYSGKRKTEFYDYDTYSCAAVKVEQKPLTFEKKKELARKKCMSIGFRDETIDMKNCILKFVTEQWARYCYNYSNEKTMNLNKNEYI